MRIGWKIKYRKKALAIANANKIKITEDNSIEGKIEKLKSQIKNCEMDLNGIFKNNIMIQDKLNNLKKQIKELEKKE